MKRFFALFLALALCIGMAACGKQKAGNEAHAYIISLLEQEEYDMAIHVIEGLRDGASGGKMPEEEPEEEPEEGQKEDQEEPLPGGSQGSFDQYFDLPPNTENGDFVFDMDLLNICPEEIRLEAIIVLDYQNGMLTGEYPFVEADLAPLGMEGLTLKPGENHHWRDGHPNNGSFDMREYQHIFRDPDGNQVMISYTYHMEDMGFVTPEQQPQQQQPQQPSGDWFFPILLENATDMTLYLVAMDITEFQNGQQLGTSIFEGEDSLSQIGLGGLVLEPGDTFAWNDAHPAVPDWNGREYRFHFAQEAGGSWVHSMDFRFEDLDLQNAPADYSGDQGQDLKTLRHGADFEVEVYDGVYWVPAVFLGGSRYTNAEISGLLPAAPEEKRDSISTLYEALQLYQIGNFTASDDNIRIFENGINWEHHKPGYHAVRTNTGCCATDSNWLRYILDGDYDEVGFLATSQRDGGGHVYNYILQDGWYYFIDLTHYRTGGSPMDTAEETGDLNHYRATDFILGNIHKTRSVQSYVNYVQDAFNDPPGLMFLYTAENVLAVDSIPSSSGTQITYEEANGQQIEVIFDDPSDRLTYGRAESPVNLPNWENQPSYIW